MRVIVDGRLITVKDFNEQNARDSRKLYLLRREFEHLGYTVQVKF